MERLQAYEIRNIWCHFSSQWSQYRGAAYFRRSKHSSPITTNLNQNWFLIKTCVMPFISSACPRMSKQVQLKPVICAKDGNEGNFPSLMDRQKMVFGWGWNTDGWEKNISRDKHLFKQTPVLTTWGEKNNAKLGVLCEQVFAFTLRNTSGRS